MLACLKCWQRKMKPVLDLLSLGSKVYFEEIE